ncbi:putative thiJ PfpI [Lyophyllum shimeji]|uniref:D-lactate dehydratase n=1 Tax=Lyophyllum shimeji TaxID=47721 RepID=A0A9P3UP12_LYOSH|nr:putative thiJ PfpI [Lyophyllum shimeji]
MSSILFVFTSASKTLTGHAAGWYLPEAAHPYYILAPHFDIDFASPAGPNPPIAEASIKDFANDEGCVKFLDDETVKDKLAHAKKLVDVDAAKYDAIFYIGGLGPVIDLAFDETNAKLASEFYQSGKVVSAVCHGPAAIVGAVDASGKSIFAGKSATSFSNAEEVMLGTVERIPFSIEDKITTLGGKFEKAKPWQSHVVVDGNLITGQNPASAVGVGEAILKALQK